MGTMKFVVRVFVMFLVLTVLGQLRWNGRSLETYYHESVNSDTFQNGWASVTAPFKWVGERFGVSGRTSQPSSTAR